jgi:hypothetical protein
MLKSSLCLIATLLIVSSSLLSCSAGSDSSLNTNPKDTTGNHSSGSVFFASATRNTFRSVDTGNSWSLVSTEMLLVQKFAANARYVFATSSHLGLFRSGDRGATWQRLTQGLTDSVFYGVVAAENGTVIVGSASQKSLFRSTDNGDTWQQISTTTGIVFDIISVGTDLFAVTASHVLLSSNNGQSWTSRGIDTMLQIAPTCITALGSTIFVGSNAGAIYRSVDRGETWAKALVGGSVVYKLTAAANVLIASTFAGVSRSTDLGVTWAPSAGIPFVACYSSASNGNVLFVNPSKAGLYRSTDQGVTWNKYTTGLTDTSFFSLGVQ